MADTLKKLKYDDKECIVECANRDYLGRVIDTTYATKTELAAKQDVGNYFTYTQNTVTVAGTSKTVSKISPETIFVPNGLIMGGTAAAAGLVTRGICGVSTPNATTGACDKDHLFLNYDGNNDYSRKVVLGAGSKGSVITGGAYTYCAVRGDQMTSYVTSVLGSYVPTSRTVNGHALSSNVTVSKSDVGLGSVVNTGDSDTPVLGGTTKFTTGGAYTLKTELENAIPTKLSDLTNDVVNNGTLTVQANGTSKGTFSANQSGNTTINITASDLGVSSAMIFGGVALQTLSEGGTQNAGATSGNYTASTQPTNGTVYLDKAQHLEYVWIGGSGTTTLGKWELLGQDGSYALSSVTVTGTGALSGGGNLTANRTISHTAGNAASKTSGFYKFSTDAYSHIGSVTAVTKADITALGIPESDTNTTYSISSSNAKITLTPSSGTAQTVTVDNVANATSATKATQDGEGNVITTTYATKSEIENVAYTNMLNDFIENQIFENGVTLQYGTGYIYWLDSTSTAGSYAYSLYQNQFRTYTGSTAKILTFPNKTGTVATLDDISSFTVNTSKVTVEGDFSDYSNVTELLNDAAIISAGDNITITDSGDGIIYLGADLSSKQDKLVSGTNLKTVNGNSLLGSGNISVTAAIDSAILQSNASYYKYGAAGSMRIQYNGATGNYLDIRYGSVSFSNNQYASTSVTFTNAMGSTNYVVICTIKQTSSSNGFMLATTNLTSTGFTVNTVGNTSSDRAGIVMYVAIRVA